jgi:hypothetical protein
MPPEPSVRERVDTRRVLLGGASILAAIVLSVACAWLLLHVWGGAVRAASAVRPAMPSPVLESHPLSDFASYEAAQRRRLTSYGWVDRPAGLVHVPIEVAMRKLEQRPGPAAPSAEP